MAENNTKLSGLSEGEVAQRINEGKVNISANLKTKSIKQIFYENICNNFVLVFYAYTYIIEYGKKTTQESGDQEGIYV